MTDKQDALILIIAANPSTSQALQAILEGTDFALHFSESDADGMQKAEELLPAAIVLDIDPRASDSGYEACRRFRANRLLKGIPILLLCDREDRDARAAG